jgi:hypothetical protein
MIFAAERDGASGWLEKTSKVIVISSDERVPDVIYCVDEHPMNATPIPLRPDFPQDKLEPNPQSRGNSHDIRDFNRTEEDDPVRATHFVSGSVIFLDDFGITLND